MPAKAAKRGRTAPPAHMSPPAPAKRGRKPAPAKAAATRASKVKETETRMTAMESTLAAILERLPTQGTPAAAQGAASASQSLPEAPRRSPVLPAQARAAHTLQVSEEARSAMLERVRDLELQPAHHHSLSDDSSTDEDYDTEEEDTHKPRRRGKFVSGRVRTADIAKPKVHQLWPHEQGLYNRQGQAQAYDDLTLGQFVQGYLATVKKAPSGERQPRLDHLQALMADTSRFPWPQVRNFHAVFLQHVEQGNMSWTGHKDEVRDLKMEHLYLPASTESARHTKPATSAATRSANGRRPGPAAPKVQADLQQTCCPTYNTAKGCDRGPTHGNMRHSCSHCLRVAGRHYEHPLQSCRRAAAGGVAI